MSYVVLILVLVSFLLAGVLVGKDVLNPTYHTKFIIIFVGTLGVLTHLVSIVRHQMDLIFLRNICFYIIDECSIVDVWHLIYNKGMRLHPAVMNNRQTALIVIKILYEYGRQINDNNAEEIAEHLLDQFDAKEKDDCSTATMASEPIKIAEYTLDYLYSKKTLSLRTFYIISQPKIQKIIYYIIILIGAIILIDSALDLFNRIIKYIGVSC